MKIRFFRAKIPSNNFLLTIVGLWAALLVITMLPGSAFAQGPIEVVEQFPISHLGYPYYFVFYAVSGDIVVFASPPWSIIYGYNLSTRDTFSIIGVYPQYLDIFGDTIVWHDQNWDIYGYDLSQDREFQITNNAARQVCPAIDGSTVVWVDWRNGGDTYDNDIYGYNINTGTEFRVTGPATTSAGCSDISGNTVVWSDSRSGSWNVYAYNLASRTEVRITDGTGSTTPLHPAISGNVIVVGGMDSVNGFDLSGNLLFKIYEDGYENGEVGPVAIDGNLVVWQEEPFIFLSPAASPHIVGYDITSGYRFPISSNGYKAWFPKISGNVVVWHGCRRSFEEPSCSSDEGLYASRLLETVQLSVNSRFVDPGDVLTYTIALAEAAPTGSHRSITDSLSSFTTLDVPSLSVTSGSYGYDSATHVITWTGDVSSYNPVTVTYNATVNPDASVGDHIVNTAIISDQMSVFTRTASTWVARRTYLPVIMRDVSP